MDRQRQTRMTEGWRDIKKHTTDRQAGEVVAQDASQGGCRGDVDVSQLGGGHVAEGALAEVDGTQRHRQSPQAAAPRQLPCRETLAVSTPSR